MGEGWVQQSPCTTGVYSLKGALWVVVSGIAVRIIWGGGKVVSAVGVPGSRVLPAQVVSIA